MKRRIYVLSRDLSMLAVVFLLTGTALAAEDFTLRNGTLAGGGGIGQADCFRLIGTIGEAVAGTTSGSGYRVTSGFAATLADHDSSLPPPEGGLIFSDGFEGDAQTGDPLTNSGACKP